MIEDLSIIYKLKLSVVVIHGGGKNIKQKLPSQQKPHLGKGQKL